MHRIGYPRLDRNRTNANKKYYLLFELSRVSLQLLSSVFISHNQSHSPIHRKEYSNHPSRELFVLSDCKIGVFRQVNKTVAAHFKCISNSLPKGSALYSLNEK